MYLYSLTNRYVYTPCCIFRNLLNFQTILEANQTKLCLEILEHETRALVSWSKSATVSLQVCCKSFYHGNPNANNNNNNAYSRAFSPLH